MEAKYSRDIQINPSNCDASGRESIDDIFDLFIDIAGEHATELDLNALSLMKKSLYWVVAKAMVRIYKRPNMYDTVTFSTWPEAGAGFRCFRSNTIERKGEVIVASRQQWAVISGMDGKPRNVAQLLPDSIIYLEDRAVDEDFSHITGEFPGEPFAVYKVKSTDIDFAGHMNNVAYIRALESLYSTKEWARLDPYEIEISYVSSCHEGDELLFSKRQMDGKLQFFAHLADGRKIAYYTITPHRN